MIQINCGHCREKVSVVMYYYGERITTHESFDIRAQYYKAIVHGKAICPSCGSEIKKDFYSCITKEDIIKLAMKYMKKENTHESD